MFPTCDSRIKTSLFSRNLRWQIAACLLIASIAVTSNALPRNNKEIIHIAAGSTFYNYKTGINIFERNVKVDQGATHITADRLITKSDSKHKIQEIIAYGIKQPAHYWTIATTNEPEIHANASLIKFYPLEATVTLEKQVMIKQGENSFQGELIHYNINEQTITVPPTNTGRSVLVYNPDK